MSTKKSWRELSTGAQVGLLTLGVVQVGLQATALAKLVRMDAADVRGGRKWPWGLGIALGELIGAPTFLVLHKDR